MYFRGVKFVDIGGICNMVKVVIEVVIVNFDEDIVFGFYVILDNELCWFDVVEKKVVSLSFWF